MAKGKDVTSSMYSFRDKAPSAPPKKFHHMVLTKGDNGGHTAVSHFQEGDYPIHHKPETNAFGPNDGGALMAHVAKHMGIPGAAEEKGEAAHKMQVKPVKKIAKTQQLAEQHAASGGESD